MNSLTKDIYVKHNLGKLLILCIHILLLQAEDFTYKIGIDKQHPYVKEAVLLTVDVNQTNHDIVLLFDFDLEKSDAYSFQRIDIQEIDAYHAAQIRYTYLLYPLQEGHISIHFNLTQKATTDESIAYSFSGDRDNIKTLETRNTKIDVLPFHMETKALPEGTQVVGDFSLAHTVKMHDANAFEPLPLQITLKGLGYPPLLKSILPKGGQFTRFTDAPIVKMYVSKEGTRSTVTYAMALSHDSSFALNPIVIKAFNPATEKSYTLNVPAQHFNITQVDSTLLIDKVDMPAAFTVDWSWVQTLFTYLLIFVAGVLSALSWRWKKKKIHKKQHPIAEKIKNAKTPKALLQVLMSNDSKLFTKSIQQIENTLYGDANISLNKLKENALGAVQ